MRSIKVLFFVGLFAIASSVVPATAEADLPPPPGRQFVSYGVQVQNIKAFAGYSIVVYPWSYSNGRPTREVGHVDEGKTLSFGRRSPSGPAFYAVKSSALDAYFAAQPEEPHDDFVTKTKAVRCDAKISPIFSNADSEPSKIVDIYRVESITESSCAMKAVKVYQRPPAPSAGAAGCSSTARSSSSFFFVRFLLSFFLCR